MGTKGAPLVAHLFLFCYERNFMMPLSDDKQADVGPLHIYVTQDKNKCSR